MKLRSSAAYFAVIAVSFALSALSAGAQDMKTPIHIFGSVRCSACLEAKQYLEFVARQEKAEVAYHDVAANPDAAALSKRVARNLRVTVGSYPLVVIGDKALVGWSNAEQGPKAAAEIQSQRGAQRPDAVAAAAAELADEKESKGTQGTSRWPWAVGFAVLLVAASGTAAYLARRRRGAGLPVNGQ